MYGLILLKLSKEHDFYKTAGIISIFSTLINLWLTFTNGGPLKSSSSDGFGFGSLAFAFISVDFTKIDGIGEVNFLLTIPIHKEEREWIMETDTFEGHLMLEEVFGNQLYFADSGRNAFIPDEQTIQDLKEFLKWEKENT